MAVYHILKDGTRLETIDGHVVRMEDAETLYQFLELLNQSAEKSTWKNAKRVIQNG